MRVLEGRVGVLATGTLGPGAVGHPDDRLRSLLDLQWDNGFIRDFVFGLEEQAGVSVKPDQFTVHDRRGMTFRAFLKALAACCQPVVRIVLRLDPGQLRNPDFAIRHALPDLLAECSGGSVRSDGYGPSTDKTALLLFLRAERLDEALACITEVVEKVPVLDNDLRSAVVAALQRVDGYEVIYPRGFEEPFPP